MFEAVHGSAPDIADQNLANPTALLLSGLMMLDHIGEGDRGRRGSARRSTEVLPPALSGRGISGARASTTEFTDAICREIER